MSKTKAVTMTTKEIAKERVATVTSSHTGIVFNVVVVPPGAPYGRDGVVTNDGGLLVEFYDTRYPHTEHGQLAQRYCVETLLPHNGQGLCLDGGIPDWSLDAAAMKEATDAVVTFLVRRKAV